ncbi:hypothetical protein ACIP98_01160 [Streptomyces sp. NPDC088354]|uniref:hypothetical protein n=1 Tax=unclassified Streptomyces TaxID=2593676 RepID=UPI0029A7331C|nr:hypothetical protein [Streptomyces sp. MI02-7b]MDX3073463.1 hypothetical protein [Streptomyces sp. MI02-7b]
MAIFLFLVLLAVVLGIIGVTAGSLSYLLFVGIVVLVADIVFFGVRSFRRARRHPLR